MNNQKSPQPLHEPSLPTRIVLVGLIVAVIAGMLAAGIARGAPPSLTASTSSVVVNSSQVVTFPSNRQLLQTFTSAGRSASVPVAAGQIGWETDTGYIYRATGSSAGNWTLASGSGGTWGTITGTLSSQSDLNTALGLKANSADLGTLATLSAISSTQITDATIVNADISASAAIALSKLATDPLARGNHTGTQAWSTLTTTPTTLAGYGIIDAQPLATTLTSIAGLANAAGVLTNDGAGVMSYTGASVGGNGAPDDGMLATFSAGGALLAAAMRVDNTVTGEWGKLTENAVIFYDPVTEATTSILLQTGNGAGGARNLSLPVTSTGTFAVSGSGNIAVNATTGNITFTGTLPVANGGTGITALGTGVATALGTNVGSAGALVTNGGALGTPSSGSLLNTAADDTAYDATSWNGSTAPPTKNAVRDKFESLPGGGKVLQMVYASKLDTASGTDTTFTTFLSASITPTSATSRVVAMFTGGIHGTSGYLIAARIARGSTPVQDPDTPGNRRAGNWSAQANGNVSPHGVPITVIDSPATTSTTTYNVQVAVESGGTYYINRSNTDTNAAAYARTTAQLILMEVSP